MNYLIGQSQAQLEAELAKAQADFLAGKTTISVSAGDANTSKQVNMSIERRIQQILKALHILDPDTYPASSVIPNRQTKAAF